MYHGLHGKPFEDSNTYPTRSNLSAIEEIKDANLRSEHSCGGAWCVLRIALLFADIM